MLVFTKADLFNVTSKSYYLFISFRIKFDNNVEKDDLDLIMCCVHIWKSYSLAKYFSKFP